MKYLIVQDWPSTHGNHAGMMHMCNLLKSKFPDEYTVLVKDCPRNIPIDGKPGIRHINKIVRKVYERYIYPKKFISLCQGMFDKLREGDEVFLLEYLFPETSQLQLALYLRQHYPFVHLYALSHLTPEFAERKYPNYAQMVVEWSRPIDKMLTLGTSLSSYFLAKGVEPSKVSTGFHYVDREYYHPQSNPVRKDPLRVITIGAMARNFRLLAEIVQRTSDLEWIICKGRKNVDGMFPIKPNIHLLGFMEEDELRHQMELSDVSVSVMDDTIGSNVITTSLSMGLAQVVSDVGSIRDYCSEKDSIFCQNSIDDFVNALLLLAADRDRVDGMKASAVRHAEDFYIEKVNDWFSSLNL